MTKSFLFGLFLLFFVQAYGQDRYMVFFTDKDQSSFNLSNPEAYLSDRALSRRAKQKIPIEWNDLPVNATYVTSLRAIGIQTFYTTKWMNGVLVQMTQDQKDQVESLPFVSSTEFVAPNSPLRIQPSSSVTEPLINPEDDLAFPQTSLLGIDVMHDDGFLGEGILIGIFDDGFQNISAIPYFQHLFKENRIAYTFDYVKGSSSVENGFHHGLRSISTIAAMGEDYLGTAPQASFILAATEDPPTEYRIEEYNWLFAAEQADSAGVDIINTSLGYSNGFTDPSMNYTEDQMDGATTVVTRASTIAASKGILLVTSAGNQGNRQWRIITAPADSEQVLAVGATNGSGELASFSSQGPNALGVIKPDVVAVGRFTSVINVVGSPTFQSGTSFSAPQVTGLAAGLWQAFPNLSQGELLRLLRESGNMADNPGNRFGYGFPDWRRAIDKIQTENQEVQPNFRLYPNPLVGDFINLSVNEENIGKLVDVQLINRNGELLKTETKRVFGSAPSVRISLSSLPNGVYLIRLINKEGSATRKFIKY